MSTTTGVLYVHSCPVALVQHCEWSLSAVLGVSTRVNWVDQPAARGTLRTVCEWSGEQGTAAKIASALRGWESMRFEVWESGAEGTDSVRYLHTPGLGIFYTVTDSVGNAMVGEDRIRYAMEIAGNDAGALHNELSLALGTSWDEELEAYRKPGLVQALPVAVGVR